MLCLPFLSYPHENPIVCIAEIEVPETDVNLLRCVLGVFDFFSYTMSFATKVRSGFGVSSAMSINFPSLAIEQS